MKQLPASVDSFELAWYPSGARVSLPFSHYLSFNPSTSNRSVVDIDTGDTIYVLPSRFIDRIFVDISKADILVPLGFVHAVSQYAVNNFVALPSKA
jgi:hypothetical protein